MFRFLINANHFLFLFSNVVIVKLHLIVLCIEVTSVASMECRQICRFLLRQTIAIIIHIAFDNLKLQVLFNFLHRVRVELVINHFEEHHVHILQWNFVFPLKVDRRGVKGVLHAQDVGLLVAEPVDDRWYREWKDHDQDHDPIAATSHEFVRLLVERIEADVTRHGRTQLLEGLHHLRFQH